MSMTLYTVTDDKRVANKTLGTGLTLNTLKFEHPTNMLEPRIIIKTPQTPFAYNYCYISDFGRYYYITNVIALSGKRIALICVEDVLYSLHSQLTNVNAILVRSENSGPTEITDSNFPVHKNKSIKIYEFSGGDFNIDVATNQSYNFVLNIMGGGASS